MIWSIHMTGLNALTNLIVNMPDTVAASTTVTKPSKEARPSLDPSCYALCFMGGLRKETDWVTGFCSLG